MTREHRRPGDLELAPGASSKSLAPTTIRTAALRDAAALARIYAPAVEGSTVSFELVAPGAEEFRRRIKETLPRFPWLVAERGGEAVGYAYACEHRSRPAYQWSVEVSVYVGEGARRQGVAKALYDELFALLRRQGFYNAYAGIALPNDASVALHESLGFAKVGVYRGVGHKLGAWRDVGWWHLLLREHAGNPRTPAHFEDLQ